MQLALLYQPYNENHFEVIEVANINGRGMHRTMSSHLTLEAALADASRLLGSPVVLPLVAVRS